LIEMPDNEFPGKPDKISLMQAFRYDIHRYIFTKKKAAHIHKNRVFI